MIRPDRITAPAFGASLTGNLTRLRELPSSPKKRETELPPIRPNVGIEVAYRNRLDRLIAEMQHDIEHEIAAAWSTDIPVLAADALPATNLRALMRRLTARWTRRFDQAAPELARYFATAQRDRIDTQLAGILRRAGISVRFTMTRTMSDAYQAAIGEQVGLIRSIATQHLGEVEGLVMRSVQTGRDLGSLSQALQERLGVTRRRAALISRDQNNKATGVFTRVRQQELGLKARWRHSSAGKTPRPTHLRNNGREYDPALGWFDPAVGRRIWPGELVNCRCVAVSVVPGFT